jgi:serine O-acetyltransferase
MIEPNLWKLICADIARSHNRSVPLTLLGQTLMVIRSAPKVKSVAVILHRIAHATGSRSTTAAGAVKQLNHVVTGADIAFQAEIGPGLALLHPTGVVIASDAVIGARCTVHQGVTIGSRPAGSPRIGDDATLGPGSRIIGDVSLGDATYVAPNAVVTHSFEGHVVLVGIPARVMREHNPDA